MPLDVEDNAELVAIRARDIALIPTIQLIGMARHSLCLIDEHRNDPDGVPISRANSILIAAIGCVMMGRNVWLEHRLYPDPDEDAEDDADGDVTIPEWPRNV